MTETETSRLEAAEHAEAQAALVPWWRSPLAMVAGLILLVGVLALIVLAATGDDTDDAVAAVATTSSAAGSSEDIAAPAISFGGAGIPEVDAVMINGDPLPGLGGGDDPALGTRAPEVIATSLANGNPIVLGDGRARVIGFFAHWCSHCQAELPEVTAWLAANELPPNTEFVAVSTAVDEGNGNYPPSAWFNEVGWAAPVVVDDADGTMLESFGFSGFPAFIAIDANGTVVARESGNIGVEGFEALFANFAR